MPGSEAGRDVRQGLDGFAGATAISGGKVDGLKRGPVAPTIQRVTLLNSASVRRTLLKNPVSGSFSGPISSLPSTMMTAPGSTASCLRRIRTNTIESIQSLSEAQNGQVSTGVLDRMKKSESTLRCGAMNPCIATRWPFSSLAKGENSLLSL